MLFFFGCFKTKQYNNEPRGEQQILFLEHNNLLTKTSLTGFTKSLNLWI